MSKADEYVERLIADAYKRELDQEENVFRSLPFFATTLGVLATAISLARQAIGPLTWEPFSIAIYVVLSLIGATTVAALLFLFLAIRRRDFKLPMRESALLNYRKELETFYAASERESATTDAAVTADIRQEMARQVAEATEIARGNNLLRLEARNRAATALILAITLVFCLLGLILFRDARAVGVADVTDAPGRSGPPFQVDDHGQGNGAASPQAGAATDAEGRSGSLDLPGGAIAPGGNP